MSSIAARPSAQSLRGSWRRKACTPVRCCSSQPAAKPLPPQQQQQQAAAVTRRLALVGASAAWLAAQCEPAFAAGASCALQTGTLTGLQWCDTQEGSGPSPVKGAVIRCHYTGSLVSNGVVFDSSYERGRPLPFTVGVGQVIRGWDLGILGSEADGIPPMKEGGKRTLVIPSELGYGSRGAGGVIPPNASLKFEVELLAKR